MDNFWEDVEFETELAKGVNSQRRFLIIYRIVLAVCGLVLFLVGWGMWNIGLASSEEQVAPMGEGLEWLFFLSGIFVQFIIGPYFVWCALSTGRLSILAPKELREFNALKRAISNKEIHNHYWAAYRDPTHEHHKEIIRYRWMDKIRWKHHPSDFFGYLQITHESGETSHGPILPKASERYRASHGMWTYERDQPPKSTGLKPPFNRLLTLPMLLFLLSVPSFLPSLIISLILAVVSNDSTQLMMSLRFSPVVVLLCLFIVWRNTDLLDAFRREQKYEVLSVEALEERMNILRETYVTVREHERGHVSTAKEKKPYKRPPMVFSCFCFAVLFTFWSGPDTINETVIILLGSFILLLLLYRHVRLVYSADSFKGYRVTAKHIYLLDGIFSRKLKRKNLPNHMYVRILDDWEVKHDRVDQGYNVCLHLVWVREEKEWTLGSGLNDLVHSLTRPGYPLSQHFDKRTLEIHVGGNDLVGYVAGMEIRFEFKGEAERKEFAERLASDLSLPLRKDWLFSDHKGANQIKTMRN